MSVWFVTGASRGLGAEITREALDRGHSVIATARDVSSVLDAYPNKPAGLLALSADVTDESRLRPLRCEPAWRSSVGSTSW